VFAFDLDAVETVFESEPHDLGVLPLGRISASLTSNPFNRSRV
jgi:hypothetical protein